MNIKSICFAFKRQNVDAFSIAGLWRSNFFGWVEIPSNGMSGGLLCVWDKSVFNLVKEEKEKY